MKKEKNTEKKLSLNKLQMAKLTNLNAIKGGDAETKTGKDNTKTKTTTTTVNTQGGA